MRVEMKAFLLGLTILLVALSAGCGETDFSSGASKRKSADASRRPESRTGGPRTDQASSETRLEDEGSSVQGGQSEGAEESDAAEASPSERIEADPATEDEARTVVVDCWFAVSGTWIMPGGSYASTFPRGKSGGDPNPGEAFDGAGGVYLAPRADPYVYGQGGKEIDGAIRHTFDGIAIPPDVKATIRAASGVVLVEKTGPWLAQATFYSAQPAFANKMAEGLRAASATMPAWVNDFLTREGRVDAADLYQAREVSVSAVPGGRCDPRAVNANN